MPIIEGSTQRSAGGIDPTASNIFTVAQEIQGDLTLGGKLVGTQPAQGVKRMWQVASASPAGAPWTLEFGGTLFGATYDAEMWLGYNVKSGGGVVQAGENGMGFVIESDYETGGQHYIEAYWEYHPNTNTNLQRPFGIQVNRSTDLMAVTIDMGGVANSYIGFYATSGVQLLKLQTGVMYVPQALFWLWNFGGAKTMLKNMNNANNASQTCMQVSAADALRLGDANAAGHTAVTLECYNAAVKILSWNGNLTLNGGNVGGGVGVIGLLNATTVPASNPAGSGVIYAENGDMKFRTDAGTITVLGDVVGFYGVTAVARPSAYTQTYATADKTHAADGSADLATTAATQTTPWGYASQAQAENIATQVNLLRATVTDVKQLLNSVIDDLQALGLLQ